MEGFNDGAGIQIIKPVETFTEKKGSISAYHPLELSISSLEPDDSTRKMSNDSGVSISTSRAGKDSPDSSIPNNSELIGEPKLSTLQNFLVQQSLALNPALMGLQSNPFSVHPWYPVWLSCVQQQQDALNGKSNPVPKQIPKEMFNMPLYNPMMSFFPNSSIPSVPVPPASMEEVLKAQMAEFQKYQKSFSPSVDDQSEAKMTPAKPQSISDDETCPPHTRHSMSPLNISACPTSELQTTRKMSTFSADDRTCSSYQEDDDRHSVASGKSSMHSYDSKSPNSGHFSQCSDNQGKLQLSHNNGGRKESVRRRKIGVIGSSISDMGLSFLQSNLAPSHNQPSEKLSTASLPANLCSGRSGGSRKRPRTLPDDEKDEIYWERRRKNNEAAKRSRDSRRAKEDEIAIRAAFLEQENLRLRVEMAAMHQELSKIKHELSECQKKKNLDKESIHSSPDKEDVCHSPPASPSESS